MRETIRHICSVLENKLHESKNFVLYFAVFSAQELESGIKVFNDYVINE